VLDFVMLTSLRVDVRLLGMLLLRSELLIALKDGISLLFQASGYIREAAVASPRPRRRGCSLPAAPSGNAPADQATTPCRNLLYFPSPSIDRFAV